MERNQGQVGPGTIPKGHRERRVWEKVNEEFQLSLWQVLLACPRSLCISRLYLWSLCHLELTRIQPALGSCDTNHNSTFILLYQPHPLANPLFSPLVTHCTFSFTFSTHPGLTSPSCLTVLSSLTFSTVSSQLLFHPIWQASDQPPLSPPFTAEHPLEHGKKKTTKKTKQKATVLSRVRRKDTTTEENVQYLTCSSVDNLYNLLLSGSHQKKVND